MKGIPWENNKCHSDASALPEHTRSSRSLTSHPDKYHTHATLVWLGQVMVSLPVRGLLASVGLKETLTLVGFLAETLSEGFTLKEGLSTLRRGRGGGCGP